MKNLVCVICIFSLLAVLVGCSSKTENYENLGSNFTPYDEEAFLEQLSAGGENRVCLAENGKILFDSIVYPNELFTDSDDRYVIELESAVKFFADTLSSMTGDEIKTAPQSKYNGKKAIIIALDENVEAGKGGYALRVSEQKIEIKAKDYSGLSGGIYAFLEDKLGCMYVSDSYDYIPKAKTIWLDECEENHTPSIEWRYVYAYEPELRTNEDGTKNYGGWNSKLRLNGAGSNDWYAWVHTSFTYVPPEEYFDEHPEYYSLYMGKRTYKQGPVSGQLCWTNEDVYKIISQKVLQEMRDNPDVHIWDVSQMDTWENRGTGCKCDKCKAIDEKEGTPMGSLLTFINRLADDVAKEFPNNYISTLAYNYTEDPPKNIKPRDNVIIKLCLMPGDCASGYANPVGKHAKKANELVASWGKVAKHIVIWDYNIDFHNYLMPFPILDTVKENNDFYLDNNVYGIFHQMSADKGGDFAELNSYVFARLMWDRNTDVQEVFNKYLTVYYGDAAPYIAEYYSALQRNVKESGKDLYIYAKPWQYATSYLSAKNIDGYLATFEKAEKAVSENEELLERVERAKAGALFAKAAQVSTDFDGREKALNEFIEICEKNDITSLVEGEQNGNELQVFRDKVEKQIKAFPYVIAGALFSIAVLAVTIFSAARHKRKYGSFLLWKKR